MPDVYITRTASYYPNAPVCNSRMEEMLGKIGGRSSRAKALVLRNNGIEYRHYAIAPDGSPSHTTAELAAAAIKNLLGRQPSYKDKIELLACGTSTADQLLPSQASMVHGLMPEIGPIECISASGSCCSGMHALKYAYLSLKSGDSKKAICCAAERVSAILRSHNFTAHEQGKDTAATDPYIAFEKDFLRWMLSDGAGAMLLDTNRGDGEIALKLEWIELFSHAHAKETCMYRGATKNEDGSLTGYLDMYPGEINLSGALCLKQDVKLLSANIVELGFGCFADILAKHGIKSSEIDFFLPHMSSFFFKSKIVDILQAGGSPIPESKWRTNLKEKGNIGAASAYTMLDSLMKSGELKKGDKILLVAPESARFSYAFCFFTVC
jgi:3-oxoacyl-[acyl-carrier-protein] synthase III